jgi:hypothetical protein
MSLTATPAIESATGATAELFAQKAAGKVPNTFAAISSPESRRIRVDRWAVMETFIRVVEAGSFSTAARHLNVGQPAVSKAIARLEEGSARGYCCGRREASGRPKPGTTSTSEPAGPSRKRTKLISRPATQAQAL